MGSKDIGINLLMECIPNHYGRLPKIFAKLLQLFNESEIEENFEMIKNIYFQCKTLLLNQMTVIHTKMFFITNIVDFLVNLQKRDPEKGRQECCFIISLAESMDFGKSFGLSL